MSFHEWLKVKKGLTKKIYNNLSLLQQHNLHDEWYRLNRKESKH